MLALAELVASSIHEVGSDLERALFGAAGPDQVAAAIEAAAPGRVIGSRFYIVSVGCVAGLRLEDGTEVVVKAHPPRWTDRFLRRAATVQAACADAGLPAPRPLAGPTPCGRGLATVEAYLEDPGEIEPTPDLVAVSAAGLAAVIEVTASLELAAMPQPIDRRPGELYPEPHSPLFDFGATDAGAEWIDDLARRSLAAQERISFPAIATHTDWSARNVRFRADGLKAIYDWDSVAATTEAGALGGAAQTWRSFGRWDDETAPTVEEVLAYMEAYGEARGRALSHDERRAAAATALWILVYSARCEHSVAPVGYAGRCRSRLYEDRDLLLRSV